MSELKLIAVAPGKYTGFAVGVWGGMISGAVMPRKPRLYGDQMVLERLDELADAITGAKVSVVVPRLGAQPATRKENKRRNELIHAWAKERGLECSDVASPIVRKRYTGNGNASDDTLMAECWRRQFFPIDASEALAIAAFHVGFRGNYGKTPFLDPIG